MEFSNQQASPLAEIDVLWITAGLSCDGDTIAMTATTQPSIEDIVRGALPWIPKVTSHKPFLAAENGDEFLRCFRQAAEGKVENFILVIEGSIPDEKNKAEGYKVDQRHPWNQSTLPRPQKRNFKEKYTWVMSPH